MIIKQLLAISVLLMLVFLSFNVLAQNTNENGRNNPFSCLGEAEQFTKSEDIKNEIKKRKSQIHIDAHAYCVIAELMKRIGDYEAVYYYEKAIQSNENEPAYELFYADYLRNFRGAKKPLFPEAENHYYEAKKKLRLLKDTGKWLDFDYETEGWTERGLITLYQEDGSSLLHWKSKYIDSHEYLKRPFVFFSSINKYAKLTTDFDGVDDARDFTSESLFAASDKRLNRGLTKEELKKIIRKKEQFETINRLRFRYKYWPVIDFFYKHRHINDAQIPNFFEPTKFHNFDLNEYGIAIQKPIKGSFVDTFLRASYKRIEREGLIEFNPHKDEDIDQFEGNAIFSTNFGPDKLNLEFNYVYQDIDPDVPGWPTRNRRIFATTLTYQLFRPLSFFQSVYSQRFLTRGIDIFGGVAIDTEEFGSVDVRKNDFFVGTSFKGFRPIKKLNTFDLTIQPTIFTSDTEGDQTQDNDQYRTNINLLYRIKDQEKVKGAPDGFLGMYPTFLHLVIPFRHDISIDGSDEYENYKIGVELDAKFISKSFRKTTFLLSARYDHQRFYKLNEDLDTVSFNISVGF